MQIDFVYINMRDKEALEFKELEEKKMKKLVMLTLVTSLVMAMAGCGSTEEEISKENDEEATIEETSNEEASPLTEEDLDGILEGVENHFVLQDAKDVDYMHDVIYDKTIEMDEMSDKADSKSDTETKKKTKVIHSVTVDDSKVDASTPGTYKATYTVKVNRPAYDEYIAQEAEKKDEANDAANGATKDVTTAEEDTEAADEANADESDAQTEEAVTEEAANDTKADKAEDSKEEAAGEEDKADEEAEPEEDDVDETDLEDVVIEKDIEIVDEERAKELVDEGESVWTDESKDYGESLKEETAAETPSAGTDTKTNDTTANNDTGSTDNANTDNSSNKDSASSGSGSSSSGGSSSGSSSSSSSSSSSKSTSCDHNWVATTHEATGHYEKVLVSAAYDEKVANGYQYVCNNCGYAVSTTSAILAHCKPGKCTESGTSYHAEDLYTTVHHDAVYENKWVQDSAAYTTYKCSKCGATK